MDAVTFNPNQHTINPLDILLAFATEQWATTQNSRTRRPEQCRLMMEVSGDERGMMTRTRESGKNSTNGRLVLAVSTRVAVGHVFPSYAPLVTLCA